MLACVDVDYRESHAIAACVLFRRWSDDHAASSRVERFEPVAAYEPGAFYRRELPCLLAVLGGVTEPLETIVVDGYVWLGREGQPGLGAHLYEALRRAVPVIGVAKTAYAGDGAARAVLRGASARPLFVTAVGVDLDEAAGHVGAMHGSHRIPTLLKEVDRLCRAA
jgi:deoxyribonuclease V